MLKHSVFLPGFSFKIWGKSVQEFLSYDRGSITIWLIHLKFWSDDSIMFVVRYFEFIWLNCAYNAGSSDSFFMR